MIREFADINNFTERFDAHTYAKSGAGLVGILATDGIDWISPKYSEQVVHAHEAGLAVWHYHFARPESDPNEDGEMGHFWRTVLGHYNPGDRLVLDIERDHPQGALGLVKYTHKLDSRLHRISGQAAIAYTYDALFRETGPLWQVISSEWWIANYGGTVKRLGAGRRMIAQQISDGQVGGEPHRMAGIGACDTNRLQRWARRRIERDSRARLDARQQHSV